MFIQRPGETIYIPHGMGHSVLNLDENVSITENFLPLTSVDEIAQFSAYKVNPFAFEAPGSAQRVFRNLVNRDLDRESRRFARAMYRQVSSVEPPEDMPEFQEDY